MAASETAKKADAQRNQRARDSRELARLAEQQRGEVEDTDHAENLIVHGQEDRERDGQDARDMYEQHEKNAPEKLYGSDEQTHDAGDSESAADADQDRHIDLSA